MPNRSPKKILVTGSTGLVGSHFVYLYQDSFSITTIGREKTDKLLNLSSSKDVKKIVEKSDSEAVINFAAYTKVDEAEKEKNNRQGEVYTMNVLLPIWLAETCKISGKKLLHISTDYVFDGKQKNRSYAEDDIPNPVDSWYAKTKYEGELGVAKVGGKFLIIRISYPYSGIYRRKLDIARAVIERLKNKQPYYGIEDQKIKPTSVDDIAQALSFLVENGATGVYHVAGNFSPEEFITPFQFAQKIAHVMDLDLSLIKPISFAKLSKERLAQRPQHTWLDTGKIETFGLRITPIKEALKRFMNQIRN